MGQCHRKIVGIVAVATLLVCVGFFSWTSNGAEPPRIIDGSRVLLLYQITVPGKDVSEAPHVAQFVQGKHQLLPALEEVVTGMATGEKVSVLLAEDQGYGTYDETKKKTVPRQDLPDEIQEGDTVQDDAGQSAIITQLSERAAVIDFNHPLAGKPFIMKIQILRIDNHPAIYELTPQSGPRILVKHLPRADESQRLLTL